MRQPYEPVDAFPNAPGLSKKLGLTQADRLPKPVRGWGPWKSRWCSICSKHRDGDEHCNLCRTGSYRNVWRGAIGHVIYTVAPWLWQWWVNR
jgi:hypothetical protein